MLPQRRQAVKDLLEAALNYNPPSREAFIREGSRGDQALSDEALGVFRDICADVSERHGGEGISEIERLKQAVRKALEAVSDDGVASEDFPGTERFEVRRRLGSGGFGTVYEGYDREQNRLVALKVLRRTNPAFLYRFKREFRALVDIRHPNLVELYELFCESQFWFFTMELIRGVNFLQYVERRTRTHDDLEPACNVARLRAASRQLAEGIVALHDVGILHRDIKPGNVLVSNEGGVRLLDFGLVRETELSGLQSVLFAGTPAYMAPEQVARLPVDKAADWYSFGVMLFQALVGSLPSASLPVATAHPSSGRPAPFPLNVPADLKELCSDLLRQDPVLRPSGPDVIRRLGGSATRATGLDAYLRSADEPVIGRDSHLAELTNLLNRTKQGRTLVVNLHGKSGIGKSTVLRAFRRKLAKEEPDVVLLTGRCHESETVPYKALDHLIDGLSHYLKTLPEAEAQALTPRDVEHLVRIFPVLAQAEGITRVRRKAADITDSVELRQRAFASLQDLLSRLADKRVVVLMIDDLQWGDLDSAAFLGGLLTAAAPPSLLFIACYRSEDTETSPFLQRWRSYLAGTESVEIHDLEVGALTRSDSKELADLLLRANTGSQPSRAESIAQESGGSPFLIDQLARYRVGDILESEVTLRQVIQRRVAVLPEDARALLEVIALAGRPISRDVASGAAGLASSHSSVSTLVTERFVRLLETNGPKEIEVYHDRLRETVTMSMPPQRRRERHLMLARALEAEGGVDPAVLAMHFQEGGDVAASARCAFAAAEHATSTLAFDRAAQFYQLTLEQGSWRGEELIGLQRKLATALVHAGRGVDAARVYLEASREAQSSVGVGLKHLAAEQLLRSAHTEEGLALLRVVAGDLGIWLAKKPWQATASIVWHGVRIAWHGLRFRERAVTEVRQNDLMILDVYWSLGIGLGLVDMIRGWDFLVRHLLLALEVGDRQRAAMSMATSAAIISGSRGRDSHISRELLSKARELSEGSDHPQAPGFIATMEVLNAIGMGDWKNVWQLSERADFILREKCTGVAWERGTNTGFGVTAAIHLGQWEKLVEYARRLPGLVEEAKSRGDIHTIHYLLAGAFLGDLVSDRPQPQPAYELYREIFSYLPRAGFFAPHLNWMLTQIDIALYEGNPALAWTVVNSAWPALSKSLLFRLKYFAIMALAAKARAAVAEAAASHDKANYLKQALRCARQIERKRTLWGSGLALVIRACVASVKGERSTTLELLARAETQLDAAQMTHWVAVCRYRRGTLLGGLDGQSLISMSEAWASSEQVVNPRRLFDMLAPGSWEAISL